MYYSSPETRKLIDEVKQSLAQHEEGLTTDAESLCFIVDLLSRNAHIITDRLIAESTMMDAKSGFLHL